MNKKIIPRIYIVSWIGSKLAAGRRSNVWPYLPVGQVRDGAGQEQVREWITSILQTKTDAGLRKAVGASPAVLGEIGSLGVRELDHYIAFYNQK